MPSSGPAGFLVALLGSGVGRSWEALHKFMMCAVEALCVCCRLSTGFNVSSTKVFAKCDPPLAWRSFLMSKITLTLRKS